MTTPANIAPSAPVTELHCTQCGGELHPEEGQIFLNCPFCGTSVFLDKSRVVFHYYLAPTLTAEQVLGELRRWMSGAQTVKDLDKKAQVTQQDFQYFPLWYFRWAKGANGGVLNSVETIDLEPAAATSVTEIRSLAIPAGDLKPYDSSLDTQSAPPNVSADAALQWLQQRIGLVDVKETSLVHVPVFFFKYTYKAKVYTALVEAGTGKVMANIFPAKAEAPYLMAGGLTAAVYLILALIAAVGGGPGTVLALVIGLVAAPILFAFAAWVANKV